MDTLLRLKFDPSYPRVFEESFKTKLPSSRSAPFKDVPNSQFRAGTF